MTKEQEQVKEFMIKAQQSVELRPFLSTGEIRKLRAKLILEEALETISKGLRIIVSTPDETGEHFCLQDVVDTFQFEESPHVKPNIVELADGLADLHYVAYCGTALAFGLDMEPIFQEVHRSNMSKFIDGHKREDGKWIKGPSYSPANLLPIIESQCL